MAKTNQVTVTLSRDEEFELMEIFGRKCSREGLVQRAIAAAIKKPKAETDTKAAPKPRGSRKRGTTPKTAATDSEGAAPKTSPKLECGNACGWTGDEPTAEKKCPECGWYVRDLVPEGSEATSD